MSAIYKWEKIPGIDAEAQGKVTKGLGNLGYSPGQRILLKV